MRGAALKGAANELDGGAAPEKEEAATAHVVTVGRGADVRNSDVGERGGGVVGVACMRDSTICVDFL